MTRFIITDTTVKVMVITNALMPTKIDGLLLLTFYKHWWQVKISPSLIYAWDINLKFICILDFSGFKTTYFINTNFQIVTTRVRLPYWL